MVVGYNTYKLNENGYTFFVPTFEGATTADKIDLQDIRLLNVAAMLGDYIQVLTEGGGLGEQYFWLDSTMGVNAGWYNGEGKFLEGDLAVSLDAGKGFYFVISAASIGASVQVAGNVRLEPLEIPLNVGGYTITGNMAPKTIDLQEIKLVNAEAVLGDYIQMITEGGGLGEQYFWLDSTMGVNAGWYSGEGKFLEGDLAVSLSPGQGLYVVISLNSVGAKIQLPSAYKSVSEL